MTNVFGPIVTGADVEAAALATLQLWMTTYLAEIERQTGRSPHALPPIRSWEIIDDLARWPEDQVPAIVLASPGLAGEPQKGGDGTYQATWHLIVAVIASGRDRGSSRSLAQAYGAAVRTLLLQQPSLGGFATAVEWIGERYDVLTSEVARTLAGGRLEFTVDVDDVVSIAGAPLHPDPEPDPYVDPGDWPTVVEADVTLEARSLA